MYQAQNGLWRNNGQFHEPLSASESKHLKKLKAFGLELTLKPSEQILLNPLNGGHWRGSSQSQETTDWRLSKDQPKVVKHSVTKTNWSFLTIVGLRVKSTRKRTKKRKWKRKKKSAWVNSKNRKNKDNSGQPSYSHAFRWASDLAKFYQDWGPDLCESRWRAHSLIGVSFECPYQHPPWSPVSIGKPAPKIHQWTIYFCRWGFGWVDKAQCFRSARRFSAAGSSPDFSRGFSRHGAPRPLSWTFFQRQFPQHFARRLHQVGPSLPDEAFGRNVVEIVFVLPVFVIKCLHSHHPMSFVNSKNISLHSRLTGDSHNRQNPCFRPAVMVIWLWSPNKAYRGPIVFVTGTFEPWSNSQLSSTYIVADIKRRKSWNTCKARWVFCRLCYGYGTRCFFFRLRQTWTTRYLMQSPGYPKIVYFPVELISDYPLWDLVKWNDQLMIGHAYRNCVQSVWSCSSREYLLNQPPNR